mmetsp:Transcript_48381/g.139144  ORF Transcript_48381/g.139144 Transcript_48381/m.139144 type:complete len:116 (-) Transcript_48381:622-969(-)
MKQTFFAFQLFSGPLFSKGNALTSRHSFLFIVDHFHLAIQLSSKVINNGCSVCGNEKQWRTFWPSIGQVQQDCRHGLQPFRHIFDTTFLAFKVALFSVPSSNVKSNHSVTGEGVL